jgi:ABC-type transporter Mla maintaining outer membrane lipid asymmetry permease subunit MlaE
MNKRIVFVGLFFLSAVPFSMSAARKNAKRNVIQNATVRQLLSSSLGSVVMGGTVGAATGTALGYAQNQVVNYFGIESAIVKFLLTAASCTLGLELSNNMINNVESALDNDQIGYDDNLMSKAAIIAALLTYFNA